jgi:hypothetical protein
MVPLINNAGQTLRWFAGDVWGQFGDDHTRPGVPLLPSERKNADGTASWVGDETLRSALAKAAGMYLPDWPDVVTPHVLRHFCASQLYLGGMDLIAIQATFGHPRRVHRVRSQPRSSASAWLRNSRCAGHPAAPTSCSRSAPASSTTSSPTTSAAGTPDSADTGTGAARRVASPTLSRSQPDGHLEIILGWDQPRKRPGAVNPSAEAVGLPHSPTMTMPDAAANRLPSYAELLFPG